MLPIYIAVSDCKNPSRQFAQIAGTYPAKLIPIAKLETLTSESASLIAVDFQDLTPVHLAELKNLKNTLDAARVGIVDIKSRQQVLQARELGFYHLVDREDNFAPLMTKLRELLGDYSEPQLSGKFSERLEQTIGDTCAALNQMSLAAQTNTPLPMPMLAKSASDITATISAEGLDSWLTAVQSHHSHTFCHTMMVAGYTVSFSKKLGFPETKQFLLGLGALVHDLGKVKIPLSILDKPGELTVEERALVNKHPEFSKEILKARKEVPKPVVDIAVWHHEMLDGTGYPDGLSASQISQSVRLVTITDIYSALTEKRSYKEAYSPRQAISVMAGMKGKLDDELFRSFRKMVLKTDLGHLRRAVT